MIRIEHLSKSYEDITPLKDVSVNINDGDVISIIGPSGMGKSTLLRCINLLERPTEGKIYIDDTEITAPGCDIEEVRRKVGMVFQSFNLFPHLTVIENIMLAPRDLLKKSKKEAYDKGMELLKTVGLSDKALNFPDELSGGQKQRIAIARTLAMDPGTILFDEPTSALDPTMVGEVQTVIRELSGTGKTMMIVTHEMNFARTVSNRVFYMDEGGIYEDGSPEQIFDHPEKEKTRRFVHGLRSLDLYIENDSFDFPGMQGSIEAYCIKNQVPYKMTMNVQLAFEELVRQNLVNSPGHEEIHLSVEYSGKDEKMGFVIEYKGEQYDLLKECDPLSLAVLKKAICDEEYGFDPSAEYANKVEMKISL